MGSFVNCILASVLQGTSLEVSIPPSLSPFLRRPSLNCSSTSQLLPLSSARFLTPLFPSLRTCIVPLLPHSFPFSTLPPFLYSRSQPPSHRCFLTPIPLHPPSQTLPLLPPSHPPSFVASSLTPCRTQFNVNRVCGWQAVLSRPLLFSAKRRVALRQWGIHSCRQRSFNGPLLHSAYVLPPRIRF